MSIEVSFFIKLEKILEEGKVKTSAKTVQEFLKYILKNHTELEEEFSEDISSFEAIGTSFNVLKNGQKINIHRGSDEKLDDGDQIVIFPLVAGG